MARLYKNQLQVYAQKRNLSLPVYISKREGPHHASRFKSKVMLKGMMYESFEYFSTVKDAENAAAKAALMSVSSDEGTGEEAPAVFKNLLQELAQKEYSSLPAYITTRSGPPHTPIFSSTVEINGESFTGLEAKTKKLAEMYAAKVAYTALRERKLTPTAELTPVAELTDGHISASNPASDGVFGKQVSCTYNKGEYNQGTEATNTLEMPELHTNSHQNISGSSVPPNASSSHKRIEVYPVTSNITLPIGATIMHRDEKWVAVAMSDANV